MDPKRDKGLKREIYLMADAALQVICQRNRRVAQR